MLLLLDDWSGDDIAEESVAGAVVVVASALEDSDEVVPGVELVDVVVSGVVEAGVGLGVAVTVSEEDLTVVESVVSLPLLQPTSASDKARRPMEGRVSFII